MDLCNFDAHHPDHRAPLLITHALIRISRRFGMFTHVVEIKFLNQLVRVPGIICPKDKLQAVEGRLDSLSGCENEDDMSFILVRISPLF